MCVLRSLYYIALFTFVFMQNILLMSLELKNEDVFIPNLLNFILVHNT